MEQPKKQITARIPESVYTEIMRIASESGVTFTDILIEALEKYLGPDLPGMCPSCHTQNTPDAKYCQMCGEPISTTEIDTMQKRIRALEQVIDAMKLYQENKDQIDEQTKKRNGDG